MVGVARMICYGQVNQGRWATEVYETAARQAGNRAKILRQAGFGVVVSQMGPQVTGVGIVRLTMLHISPGEHRDTSGLPEVEVCRL